MYISCRLEVVYSRWSSVQSMPPSPSRASTASVPAFLHGLGWNIAGTARNNGDGMEFLPLGNNGWTAVNPPRPCETHR